MTTQFSFSAGRNTDFAVTVVINRKDGETLDLAGYRACMQIRAYAQSPTVVDELTTENGRIQADGNTLRLSFVHEKTKAYPTNTVYDLYLVSPAEQYSRVLAGKITTSEEVTRCLP